MFTVYGLDSNNIQRGQFSLISQFCRSSLILENLFTSVQEMKTKRGQFCVIIQNCPLLVSDPTQKVVLYDCKSHLLFRINYSNLFLHNWERYHQNPSSQLITLKSRIFPVKNASLRSSGSVFLVAKSSVFKTSQVFVIFCLHI